MSLYKHREEVGAQVALEDRAKEDGGRDGRLLKGGRGSGARGSRRGPQGKINLMGPPVAKPGRGTTGTGLRDRGWNVGPRAEFPD